MDEPLIYTTKGNVPASSLRYETGWHDEPGYVKFVERHYLGDELVKESAHVLVREGEGVKVVQGVVGGGPSQLVNTVYSEVPSIG